MSTFKTSESTVKIDDALAKAQAEITSAAYDSKNPHYGSRYSSLAAVSQACRPALAKYAIAVIQAPLHSEDNRCHLLTRLSHAGEFIEFEMSCPVDKNNAQGFGSAITYLKRFSLAAAVGVVSDDDDDGSAASKECNSGSDKNNKTPKDTVSTLEQATGVLRDYINRKLITERQIKDFIKITTGKESIRELNPDAIIDVMQGIERSIFEGK